MGTLPDPSPQYLSHEETLVSFVESIASDQGISATGALDHILHAARGNEVSSLKESLPLPQLLARIRTAISAMLPSVYSSGPTESAVGRARDTEEVVRSHTATWQNAARRVEERIGHCFKILEATVRHCVAAKRSSSAVAAVHKPSAAVLGRRFARASDEWHVDGHFSNELVKRAITTALHRRHIVVFWDDHACLEFSSSTFTKLPVVMSLRLHKTAPYSDATVVTGQLKCVTSSVLPFYLPKECGPFSFDVSQKYELCCQPPLSEVLVGPWLCPDCLQDHEYAPPSRGTDADYVPFVTCPDATSSSTSSSNSSSSSDSSDSSSDSSNDSSSDSSNSSSFDSDDSSGSASD